MALLDKREREGDLSDDATVLLRHHLLSRDNHGGLPEIHAHGVEKAAMQPANDIYLQAGAGHSSFTRQSFSHQSQSVYRVFQNRSVTASMQARRLATLIEARYSTSTCPWPLANGEVHA